MAAQNSNSKIENFKTKNPQTSQSNFGMNSNQKMLQASSGNNAMSSSSKKDIYKTGQNDKNCGYNSSTQNSQSFKREDKRSVTQNNINIGTMVGNLHLGPSISISSRYNSKR